MKNVGTSKAGFCVKPRTQIASIAACQSVLASLVEQLTAPNCEGDFSILALIQDFFFFFFSFRSQKDSDQERTRRHSDHGEGDGVV